MKLSNIDIIKSVRFFVNNKKLNNAIERLRPILIQMQLGEYLDRLDDIEMNYKYLVEYFIQGADDPHRIEIFQNLCRNASELTCDVSEIISQKESNFHDYVHFRSSPQFRSSHNFDECFEVLTHYSVGVVSRDKYEEQQRTLFNILWLNSFLTDSVIDFYKRVFSDSGITSADKCLALTALTLNLFRHFSTQKLDLLIDTCLHNDAQVQQRALVGLCFVMIVHNEMMVFYPHLLEKMHMLLHNACLLDKVELIIKQIIRTSETPKVISKMSDEIIPEIMKMRSKGAGQAPITDLQNPDNFIDFNPDWADYLETSGVGKKMKELSDMQMDGADIYVATFGSMKKDPFFEDSYRWFLPFDTANSHVANLFGTNATTAISALVNSHALCNSDKYSFCLMVLQMPEVQRKAMTMALGAEVEQLAEATQNVGQSDMLVSNLYIQELYRYYNQNRPVHLQFNIFQHALTIHRTHFFEYLYARSLDKLNIANYYFYKKQYAEALEVFLTLENNSFEVEILQKMAFCYEQGDNITKAIELYRRVDVLVPDSVWTLKRLAMCYQTQGEREIALEYYSRIDVLKPDDKQTQLYVAYCLVELGRYDEAMHIYYKLDIEYPNDLKICRSLAWCAFLYRNLEVAQRYWQQVLELEPTYIDYLNAAHNAWCLGQRADAISYYRISKELSGSKEDFWSKFHEDVPFLIERGVQDYEILLLADAI